MSMGSHHSDKPHMGHIRNWFKSPADGHGLGYIIRGEFVDHPEFAGCKDGHTSYVVAHDDLGNIETKNSRYTLKGPERVFEAFR